MLPVACSRASLVASQHSLVRIRGGVRVGVRVRVRGSVGVGIKARVRVRVGVKVRGRLTWCGGRTGEAARHTNYYYYYY